MGNKRVDTVGDLVRHSIPLLARCEACGHERLFRAAELQTGRKNPYATRWETLKFRCTVCRSRRVKTGIQPFHMR
jgi:DNA-directed RNA polymerase subunit RPC12/RpoP